MSTDCNANLDIIELLPVGVIHIARDLHIKTINQKAIELIGLKEEDLLISSTDAPELKVLFDLCEKIFNSTVTSTQQLVEINNRFLSFTAQHITRDSCDDILIIIKDSTTINSLERIRRDYISTILHSMRTPLATLTNSLNVLSMTTSSILNSDQNDALSMSISEVTRLNTLLDDLKELFFIESNLAGNYIRCESVTFKFLLDKVIKMLFQNDDLTIEDLNRLIVEGDQGISIQVDPIKMARVLYNVIKNAFTYSDKTSEVNIVVRQDMSVTSIEISDQGIGVSEEQKMMLFSKFFREDNPVNRSVHGNGLGLYFAKAWIELMNGSIMCETSQEKGTIITLTIMGAGR